MSPTILVVDDDRKIVNLVALYLKNEGCQVLCAYDGLEAVDMAVRDQPDLVVLDLMLPGLDGIEVCRLLRQKTDIPIIMLTARTAEDDRLEGLHLGADDYVTKPFSPRELAARVQAVLRRSAPGRSQKDSDQVFGELALNFSAHTARVSGQELDLTPTERRLLEALARQPQRCFDRSELIDGVYGMEYEGLDRTIDVHVMNLRRKLEQAGCRPLIVTVPGHGYRLEV